MENLPDESSLGILESLVAEKQLQRIRCFVWGLSRVCGRFHAIIKGWL